jgi:TATA-box binding protein (TBP) (component of TFIID and TFIIIB)
MIAFKIQMVVDYKTKNIVLGSSLDSRINLDIFSRYVPLDDHLVGLSYGDVIRGKIKGSPKERDFGNQCTLNIMLAGRAVNVKLFSDGKMVLTNCGSLDDGALVAKFLDSIIPSDKFEIEYGWPFDRVDSLNKLEYKTTVYKYYRELEHMATSVGIKDFRVKGASSLKLAGHYAYFCKRCSDEPDYLKIVASLYQVLCIVRKYGDFDIKLAEKFYANTKDGVFTGKLPVKMQTPISPWNPHVHYYLVKSYYDYKKPISRDLLVEKLRNGVTGAPVEDIKYNRESFPGVIFKYNGSNVIVFGSGKVNVSTKNMEDIESVFLFVDEVLDDDIFVKEADIKVTEKSLNPLIFSGGEYYLHKDSILHNPRNVKLLHKFGLLDKY